MRNLASQTFTQNGTFTPQAGVRFVTVVATKNPFNLPVQGPNSGGNSAAFIDGLGNVHAWGANTNAGSGTGELGDATIVDKSSPVLVVGGLNFRTLTNNGARTFHGITDKGQLWGWGINSNGDIGDGTTVAKSSPVLVAGGLTFQPIISNCDTGGQSTGAVLGTNGSIYTWGIGGSGQLGNGASANSSTIVQVVGGLTFAQIANNGSTMLGLTTGGTAYAWGANTKGQVGDGTTVNKSSPVAVLGGLTFANIWLSSGGTAFGLTAAGALWAWGANTNGEIGDGTSVAKSSPVLVVGGLTWKQVIPTGDGGGSGTILGLTTAGAAYGWGNNNKGQVGNNTNQNSLSSPVAVLGGLTFQSLFLSGAGSSTAFGLTSAGTLWAWGANAAGQVGDGTTVAKSSPVLVVGGLTFQNLFTCGSSIFGATTAGSIYSWGDNTQGKLGVGDVASRSSPTLVLGSLTANLLPAQTAARLAVTPGQAYAVTLNQFYAMFGSNIVANGRADSITIFYEQ
jgi:alpha-tubulin suppressor-like RCC1 family protein